MFKLRPKGFTLIELLVVIAIIGVLSTLAIVALGNARAKARDAKRVADMKQISAALEIYYSDNGSYPAIITSGNSLVSLDGTKVYMGKIPSNPTPRNDGSCPDLEYRYNSNGLNYSLMGCISNNVGDLAAGGKVVSSLGLRDLGTPDGLVAYWPLDEASGTSTYDMSNSNITGTVAASVQLGQSGKVGSAMLFNGTSSLVNFGITPAIDISTGDFSVAAWFNTSSLSGYQYIFNKGTGFLIDGYGLYLNDNKLVFTTDGADNVGGQDLLNSDINISQNTWYYVAGVRRAGVKYLYINGQSQSTTRSDARELSDNSGTTFVGRFWLNPTYYFNGYIDDVRVYNRALSDAEVLTIYNATK